MKPAAFDYARPGTLAEAIGLLAADEDAKPIAGGQSLMPMLAFRMAAPSLLVDLSGLPELKGVETGPQGTRLGALTRWRDVLTDPGLAVAQPLLVAAVAHVAHYQIRNRGTVGGSCCHADPAAEMPAVALTCGATFEVAGTDGTVMVSAEDFFLGVLTTVLAPAEILVAIHLPPWPSGRRHGFAELSRRQGDFAIAGCAVHWDDAAGLCRDPRVGVFGVGDTPLRLAAVEQVLAGRRVDEATIAKAVVALGEAIDPQGDLHADATYRRAMAGVMLGRALRQAAGSSEKDRRQ